MEGSQNRIPLKGSNDTYRDTDLIFPDEDDERFDTIISK